MTPWSPALEVGNAEIDSQHRELHERARLFAEGAATKSRQEVGILFSYLRHHALVHFGAEEEWMRAARYPGLKEHKAQHDAFLAELLALSEDHVAKGSPGLRPDAVADWLDRWLRGHVAIHDAALARYLERTSQPPIALSAP